MSSNTLRQNLNKLLENWTKEGNSQFESMRVTSADGQVNELPIHQVPHHSKYHYHKVPDFLMSQDLSGCVRNDILGRSNSRVGSVLSYVPEKSYGFVTQSSNPYENVFFHGKGFHMPIVNSWGQIELALWSTFLKGNGVWDPVYNQLFRKIGKKGPSSDTSPTPVIKSGDYLFYTVETANNTADGQDSNSKGLRTSFWTFAEAYNLVEVYRDWLLDLYADFDSTNPFFVMTRDFLHLEGMKADQETKSYHPYHTKKTQVVFCGNRADIGHSLHEKHKSALRVLEKFGKKEEDSTCLFCYDFSKETFQQRDPDEFFQGQPHFADPTKLIQDRLPELIKKILETH